MISFDDAFAHLMADLAPVSTEIVALANARGRVLAGPVFARRTQPPTPTSAMDGYAVRSADLSDKPARLTLVAESAAGRPTETLIGPGQTARISTGAAIPPGADQVVVSEESTRDGDHVTLDARPAPSAHIRPAGIDFSAADRVLDAGRRLDPAACGLAASAGALWLTVRRKPKVAIISTGDELVEAGEPADDHQIINSNAIAVAGLIADAGGEPAYLGIARDKPESVRELYALARGADLLVTIGGASIGDHDHVRSVFEAEGGTLTFSKIAIKPGKPCWFGRLPGQASGQPVLGLPGNPVSALVAAQLLLRPAVRRLVGESGADRMAWDAASLAHPLPPTGPRETFVRGEHMVVDGRRCVSALANQDSAALSVLVSAEVLIRRRAGAPAAEAGDAVEILVLRA